MQLLLVLAVVFLVVFGIYAKKSTFSKKAKVGLVLALAIFILFAWMYEANTAHQSEQNRLMIDRWQGVGGRTDDDAGDRAQAGAGGCDAGHRGGSGDPGATSPA